MLPNTVRSSGPTGQYIKHIVIVVQENRSFDNLFSGFPGADSATSGTMHNGKVIPLHWVNYDGVDIPHLWQIAMGDWDNGKMDGFDLSNRNKPSLPATFPYARLDRKLVAPYWDMASTYVLADHMFPTEFGGSFTAHMNLIAGTSQIRNGVSEVDIPQRPPWGCDAPAGTPTSLVNAQRQVSYWQGPFPCFTQFTTMADTLDASGVSWKYYAPNVITGWGGAEWSAFDAISNVRNGPDWQKNVISPETTILTDIPTGKLPSVTWIVPAVPDSDHGASKSMLGPSWVSAIVNTIGKSQYWDSTAIVVLWDDWGGWYDNVPPPQLDYVGLGIRVPCIIISPYAKAGYVSHTQYEFGSVLKFVEQTFGLSSLGHTDDRANSLVDSFDFTQAPRAFKTIPAPYPPSTFMLQAPSSDPPDDN